MIVTIVLAVLGAWLSVGVLLAFAIGRAMQIADRRSPTITDAGPIPQVRGAKVPAAI